MYLIRERIELFMVQNLYLGYFDKFNLLQSSHADGYIFYLPIVNTFHVAHLHTLLMKIFSTKIAKVILNLGHSLVFPIPLTPGVKWYFDPHGILTPRSIFI